jgi:hypothetical protein
MGLLRCFRVGRAPLGRPADAAPTDSRVAADAAERPVRAASTAALRARECVWNAISLMSPSICEVPSAAVRMRAMASSRPRIDCSP